MRRADEGLRTARAFLKMEPEHRQTRFGFQRLGDLRDGAGGQAEHGGHPRAGGEEVAARDALGLRMLPDGGTRVGGHKKAGWLENLIYGFTATFGPFLE